MPARSSRLAALLLLVAMLVGALPAPHRRPTPTSRCRSRTRSCRTRCWPVCGSDTDAPGTNDWSCKPTAAHPEPVVLVHGTFGNKSTNWQTYGPLLANRATASTRSRTGRHPRRRPNVQGRLRRPGRDRVERRRAEGLRRQGPRQHGRRAGRHRGAFPRHADAELLRQVPGWSPVHRRLRLAGAVVARHQSWAAWRASTPRPAAMGSATSAVRAFFPAATQMMTGFGVHRRRCGPAALRPFPASPTRTSSPSSTSW